MQRLVERDDEDEDAVAQKDDHVAQCREEERGEDSIGGQVEAFQLYNCGHVVQVVHLHPLIITWKTKEQRHGQKDRIRTRIRNRIRSIGMPDVFFGKPQIRNSPIGPASASCNGGALKTPDRRHVNTTFCPLTPYKQMTSGRNQAERETRAALAMSDWRAVEDNQGIYRGDCLHRQRKRMLPQRLQLRHKVFILVVVAVAAAAGHKGTSAG